MMRAGPARPFDKIGWTVQPKFHLSLVFTGKFEKWRPTLAKRERS